MKILIATRYRSVVGGAEVYLSRILKPLADRGYELRLLVEHDRSGGATAIDDTVPGIECVVPESETPPGTIAAWKPDVIYSQGLDCSALECRLAGLAPLVRYAHDYSGVCATGTRLHLSPRAAPCNRRFGFPCLVMHYPRRCGGLNPLTAVRGYRAQLEKHRVLERAARILVAATHMRDLFRREVGNRIEITLLPYPLHAPVPAELPDREPGNEILYAGRLTRLKGVHVLIEALRLLECNGRNFKLVVAGDGPERERLERQARASGITARFLGWIAREELDGEMERATLVAVPSLWPEPFGMTGIEAARVGTPAVAFSRGGIADWLVDGVSGHEATGATPGAAQLADAITRATGDPGHYRMLRAGARETARRYGLENHVMQLSEILQAMLRVKAAR